MDKQIYIVEDLDWLREILAEFLVLQPGLDVCGTAPTAEKALQDLPAGADVVTVDLSLGGGVSGLDLVALIHERWPDLPCIVLSGQPEIQVGSAARNAGAVGYVEKGDEETLLKTIYDILDMPTPSAS